MWSGRILGAMVMHTFKDQVNGIGCYNLHLLGGASFGTMLLCALAKPGIQWMLASSRIFNKTTL